MLFSKAVVLPPPHKRAIDVLSPVNGKAMSLDQSSEPVLSHRLYGEGALIAPTGSQLLAPFDGVVSSIDPIGSRVDLTSAQGIKLRILTGWQSDTLLGEGFAVKVKGGDKIAMGQELLSFHLPLLKSALDDPRFVVTVTNSHKVKGMKLHLHDLMAAKDPVFTLYI